MFQSREDFDFWSQDQLKYHHGFCSEILILLFLLLVNVFINLMHSDYLMEINSNLCLSCTTIAQSLIIIILIFFCPSILLRYIFFNINISFLKFLILLFKALFINLKVKINRMWNYLVYCHL
jgi:hypothetical protein